MNHEERILRVSGLNLAAKIWGPPSGKPVLALHGWLDNAASFDGLAPLMAGDLQIVALDLPGHGRSQWRSEDGAYHFIDSVQIALEAANALGWDRYSILGHSMGAAIASLTAPVAGEALEAVVFIDGFGPWSNAAENVVEQLRRGLAQEKALLRSQGRGYESLEDMCKAMGEARKDLSPEKLMILARRSSKKQEDGKWTFSHDRRLQASSRIRLTEEQVLTFLGAIACPTLLVRPKSGWPLDADFAKRRTSAVPDLKIIEVEGGHHVHLEAPERLADEVKNFLIHR